MKFEQMQEFVMLAEKCNYMETAEDLHISEATLSRHIKDMETELGIPLFIRSTRKVSLTEYGIILLPYAREALELQKRYMSVIAQKREEDHNSICIGSFTKAYDSGVSDVIAAFQDICPEAHIQMIWNESDDLLNALKNELCDFIFVRESQSESSEDLERILFAKDSIRVFLSAAHPLANQPYLQIEQLKDEPFFMTEGSSLTSKMAMELCQNAGFVPDILLHGSKQQILNMLNKGVGIALLFKGNHSINQECSTIISLDLHPKAYAYINMIYSKKRKFSPVQSSFIEFVRSWSKGNNIKEGTSIQQES